MNISTVNQCLETLRHWDATGIAPAEGASAYIDYTIKTVAPYAEDMGYSKAQHEIQELAIKLGYPEEYKSIKKLLMESELMCEMVFKTFALPIRSMLDEMGLEYEFKYRMKSVFSIWRKMRVHNIQFDDIYDLFAARIVYKPKATVEPLAGAGAPVLDDVEHIAAVRDWHISQMDPEILYCWRIYTVISMLYRIHPDRIRDWITHPKPSGYQALQITVMGPDCNWIEIQIRSERMDYEAEYGKASHGSYKRDTLSKL